MTSGLKEQFRETEHGAGCVFKQTVADIRIKHFSTAAGMLKKSSLSHSSYMPYHPFTDGKIKQRHRKFFS